MDPQWRLNRRWADAPADRIVAEAIELAFKGRIAVVSSFGAEAAVLLMRPRDRIEPLDVAPRAYFSEAQIEKAHAFRSGQLWLYAGQLAIELAPETNRREWELYSALGDALVNAGRARRAAEAFVIAARVWPESFTGAPWSKGPLV